ncbi:MAG: hypothetical protein C4326_05810 [Ignavibacteria bacterium]
MYLSEPTLYDFFGVRFSLRSNEPSLNKTLSFLYRHFMVRGGFSEETKLPLRFTLMTDSEYREPSLRVDTDGAFDLADVLRRGSNKFRFRIRATPEGGGWNGVQDAFLSHRFVMAFRGNECRFHDPVRWRAYAESVIFHCVLSILREHSILHAGVVAKQGNGVVLGGGTNRGKTTLTLGLVRNGFSFLSDDLAFIDPRSKFVAPFPRAVSVHEKTVAFFPECRAALQTHPTMSLSGDDKWLVDVNELIPNSLGSACPVRTIILLEGFAERTELKPLSRSEAVIGCLNFAHGSAENAVELMLTLSDLVRDARCYSLRSGVLPEVVDMITQTVMEP